MSRMGKLSLLIAGLCILGSGIFYLLLNIWTTYMYIGLGLALAGLIFAVVVDLRFYAEFFTMRTTKHGMNMGALILIALVFLVTVNFLATKYDKKFDFSKEKWNSLSDQSVKAAKALDQEVDFILLAKKDQQADQVKKSITDLIQMYQNQTSKIKFDVYNPRTRFELAKKFEMNEQMPFLLVVQKGDKHVKVDTPNEEGVTKALLKLATNTHKAVYFLEGHGEKSPEDTSAAGLSALKEDMTATYDVKTLNLLKDPTIPGDAAAVIVAGPQQELLPSEMIALRNFAREGGGLFLAADPGEHHNLAQLMKSFGVEFQNDYILDQRLQLPQEGFYVGLGVLYSKESKITQNMHKNAAIFPIASGLKKAPDAPKTLKLDDLITTDDGAYVTNEHSEQPKAMGPMRSILAIDVKGQLRGAKEAMTGQFAAKTAKKEEKPELKSDAANKEFQAILVGNSNFMKNEYYQKFANRDFTMNSISSLAKDEQMISIRPNTPKGTKLEMTRYRMLGILFLFIIPLPIVLFLSSGLIWWRRRTA